MSVSNTIQIAGELIDITRPCDVVVALRKMQLRLATGGLRLTVRLDTEEVTFQRADDARLTKLIGEYESACSRTQANPKRTRFAKRFRFQ